VSDVPCPFFSDSADRIVCWPNGDIANQPVHLDASSVAFEPSTGGDTVETVAFDLHSDSDQGFGLNPHDWALYRWTGDDEGTGEDSLSLVQDLSDGVHAFQVTSVLGEGSDDPTRVECVALFAVGRECAWGSAERRANERGPVSRLRGRRWRRRSRQLTLPTR
jgi:hypothetical protein